MAAILIAAIFAASYFYCIKSPNTRYKIHRMEGYRLYFYVGAYGAALATLSGFVFLFIDILDLPTKYLGQIFDKKGNLLTVRGLGITEAKSFTFVILSFLWAFILCAVQRTYYAALPVRLDLLRLKLAKNNPLEYLLFECSITEEFVCITTKSDKVYVGLVEEFEPSDGKIEFISLLPMLSGYRNGKKKIRFTTNYYDHYEQYVVSVGNNELNELDLDDFRLVLPTIEIASVSRFDVDAYIKFMKSEFNGFKEKSKKSKVSEDLIKTGGCRIPLVTTSCSNNLDGKPVTSTNSVTINF